ncbi:hypothetical protein EOM09_04405 [bacterium]|nr:hypothetical protein [bacterium]
MQNTAFSIGAIALIDKVNKNHNLFNYLFSNLNTKNKQFIEYVKCLVQNKLDKDVSEHQLLNVYPAETMEFLGFIKQPSERTLYRILESIGEKKEIINQRLIDFLIKNNLLDKTQYIDWSSAFFQGKKAKMAKHGYSRDHRPDKKQINFGVWIGDNNIPTIVTIQKGNIVDKVHLEKTLKIVSKSLKKKSLLVFDCGANTEKNKKKIIKMGFNYLTLIPKKKTTYKKYIEIYNKEKKEKIIVNKQKYYCVKYKDEKNIKYIFFSEKKKKEQMKMRTKKFEKELEKNNIILNKVKRGKEIKRLITKQGHIIVEGQLQKIFGDINNPYISGIEGFFILESSVDDDSKQILKTYKNRDKTEKLIRALKDGLGLRPIRHTSNNAITGKLLVTFLANLVICLTLNSASNNWKNKQVDVKLLKKIINCLTLTRIYQKVGLRITVLSNISLQISEIFGDFIKKYEDKSIYYSEIT